MTTTGNIACSIRQSTLRALLERAKGAVGRMHPYFLLDVYLTRVTCCANDMRVGVISEIDLRDGDKIDMGGTVCMSAGKIWDIISSFPDQQIALQGLDNNRLSITCGYYSGVIQCVDHEMHFPDMVAPGGAPDFSCEGVFLNDLHASCRHALGAGDDDIKSGLHIRAEKGNLVAAATDGHRLSLAAVTIPYDDDCEPFNAGVTISGRALDEIGKIGLGQIDVRIRDNRMSLEKHHITIISRLLDGLYPAYRRIIPADHPHCLVVNARLLLDALGRVNILRESDGITLASSGSGLTLSAANSAGDVSDSIDCETEGDPLNAIITPKHLQEAVKSLSRDTDDIIIKYRDGEQPLVIIPADHSNWNERLEIIVPRRR